MGRVVLVTGGCRSGKSGYAQTLVEQAAEAGRRLYLATAEIHDGEMRDRVERHRADRAGRGWDTLEAPLELSGALAEAARKGYRGVLVDCLTLWTANRFFGPGRMVDVSEDHAAAEAALLAAAARTVDGTVVLVTNEVGWGVVPDNAMARAFRDCAGRVNQTVAREADEAVLMACGLPLRLKNN